MKSRDEGDAGWDCCSSVPEGSVAELAVVMCELLVAHEVSRPNMLDLGERTSICYWYIIQSCMCSGCNWDVYDHFFAADIPQLLYLKRLFPVLLPKTE